MTHLELILGKMCVWVGGCVCVCGCVRVCVFEFSLSILRRFVNLESSTLYHTIYTSTVYLYILYVCMYLSIFFFLYTYITNHQYYMAVN